MDKLEKISLDNYCGYYEVSRWHDYVKSFLENVSYKWKKCPYTRTELFKESEILKLIQNMPYSFNVDPIMYLLSIGEIEVYTLENLINRYPQTVTYVIDRALNYKGCTFLLSGRVDLTPEQKANMTPEEIEEYELGEEQLWDWESFDIFVDTHAKSIASLGIKYASLCYDLDESVCFCIDNIAKRMYQKAVETGEWLNTVYEDEMTAIEEVKVRTEEYKTLALMDNAESETRFIFIPDELEE